MRSLSLIILLASAAQSPAFAAGSDQDKIYSACLEKRQNKLNDDFRCNKFIDDLSPGQELSSSDREAFKTCIENFNAAVQGAATKCRQDAFAQENPGASPESNGGITITAVRHTNVGSLTPVKKEEPEKPEKDTITEASKANAPASFDSGESQPQIQAELSVCLNAQSQASQCCNNPTACAGNLSRTDQQSLATLIKGPQSGQSMTEYCAVLKKQSADLCFTASNLRKYV